MKTRQKTTNGLDLWLQLTKHFISLWSNEYLDKSPRYRWLSLTHPLGQVAVLSKPRIPNTNSGTNTKLYMTIPAPNPQDLLLNIDWTWSDEPNLVVGPWVTQVPGGPASNISIIFRLAVLWCNHVIIFDTQGNSEN